MNSHPLLYIVLVILAMGALALCNFLYGVGISYLFSIPTLGIITMIIYFVAICKLNKYDWYKEETDYEYKKYKAAYDAYKWHVIKNKELYNIFVRDYCNSTIMLTVSVNQDGSFSDSDYNTKNRIYHRIKSLLEDRNDLVNRYFKKGSFRYTDYLNLIKEYNTTAIEKVEGITTEDSIEQEQPAIEDLKEKLFKVRTEILKYESGEKQPKHIGQRMFGYLLKDNYLIAYNDEQRLAEWQKFTGLDSKPEMSYLRDPDYNKNETDKINKQLKSIEEFFYLIGLDVSITYYEKGKKK